MIDAVRFELRTPLASWATTGHVLRTTDATPSWSAVVGLVGAAFGWPRDSHSLYRFAAEYAMAVRVIKTGSRLEDYHTIQSPNAPKARSQRVRTRSEELQIFGHPSAPSRARDTNTTITRREYMADVQYEILLVPLVADPADAPVSVVHALASPVYPLYAGRRGCLIGRLPAELVTSELESLLAAVGSWDNRLQTSRKPAIIRERRDMPMPQRQFGVRSECHG